jgi:hypothetical protein
MAHLSAFLAQRRESPWVRVLHKCALAVPILAAALYILVVTVYNLPPSPLKVRAQPVLDSVIDPYLTQRWRLFAPNPPNGNYDGWVQVQYSVDGVTQTSPVLALTQPLIAEAKTHWLFPGRIDRTAINLGYALADITSSELKLEKVISGRAQRGSTTEPASPIGADLYNVLPAAWNKLEGAENMSDEQYFAAARESLKQARAHVSAQLARIASMLVPGMGLTGEPVQLRVFYTWTEIVRFSERDQANPQTQQPIRIGDTGWLPYLRPEHR